jgi:hypothetical protein
MFFSSWVLCSFFLFGEEKKGTEKREAYWGKWGRVQKIYSSLKFFWAAFLSRKAAPAFNKSIKKASPCWTRPVLPCRAAHDPFQGSAKRRLNHQPLNQKDPATFLPMTVLLSS